MSSMCVARLHPVSKLSRAEAGSDLESTLSKLRLDLYEGVIQEGVPSRFSIHILLVLWVLRLVETALMMGPIAARTAITKSNPQLGTARVGYTRGAWDDVEQRGSSLLNVVVTALMSVYQNSVCGDREILVDVPDDKTLLPAVTTPAATSANEPSVVWRNVLHGSLVNIVTVTTKEFNVALGVVFQLVDEVTWNVVTPRMEVIARIVIDDEQVLGCRLLNTFVEKVHCNVHSLLQNGVAVVLAARVLVHAALAAVEIVGIERQNLHSQGLLESGVVEAHVRHEPTT